MITASEAAASITSDSLIPPAPARITLTAISSCGSFAISSWSASSEPETSALSTMLSSLISPSLAFAKTSSRVSLRAWRRASCSVLSRCRALLGELAGAAVVLDHLDALAGLADALEAEHLDRVAGPRLLEPGAGVVLHRPHLAPLRPGDDRVADVQRAALDQHRGHRAAARVEVRLDHRARGRRVRVRLQLLDLGDQEDVLEQVVEVLVRLRRDVDEDRVAAPVLGVEALGGELALDLVGRWRPRGRSC